MSENNEHANMLLNINLNVKYELKFSWGISSKGGLADKKVWKPLAWTGVCFYGHNGAYVDSDHLSLHMFMLEYTCVS